jgi:hypothetical protein
MPEATEDEEKTLGEYVVLYSSRYWRQGWQKFVTGCRLPSDFATNVKELPHHAAHLLDHLCCHGASVLFNTMPWTHVHLEATLARGSHKSAVEYLDFLQTAFLNMMKRGQWILLPYALVKDIPNLCPSPLGVVPQRDRCPRVIVDYTFNGVNADSLWLAPLEAMQFGHALQRLLEAINNADPWYSPVYLIKIDIANGFYRVWVNTDDIPKLGIVFPAMSDSDQLIAFPLVLPMGWKESLPYFCATTEMAVDLANQAIPMSYPGPHCLDSLADTLPPPEPPSPTPPANHHWTSVPKPPRRHRRQGLAPNPLGSFHVFVDDAIGIAQGGTLRRTHLQCILFNAIDSVFRPLDASDPPQRQEPIWVKKLSKRDGCWTMRKVILGWLIDMVRQTVSLPPHRVTRLQDILDSIPLT